MQLFAAIFLKRKITKMWLKYELLLAILSIIWGQYFDYNAFIYSVCICKM